MKVLFIYPQLYAQVGFNYGVAFLSAVLKSHGHQTTLLDINERMGFDLDLDRIRREIESFSPDLIGFSLVTNQFPVGLQIARSIRSYWKSPLIAGGVHVTMDPRGVLESGAFDYACVGEGEEAMLELVERLVREEDTTHIENIWVSRNGEIVENPVRPFPDLKTLPQKDYEVFDYQRFLDVNDGWVRLMTSRGCPFQCTYCFNHQIVERYKKDLGVSVSRLHYLRHHPVEQVMDELRYLQDNYRGISTIIFDDDLFTIDRKYILSFCKAYREVSTFPFVCNAHVKVFDQEVAVALKEAGCKMVKFGIESGSERVRREVMNRRMNNEEIIRAFEVCHGEGLESSAFVMFGLPSETREEMMMTLDLLAGIQPQRVRWAVFFPYIGTRAFEMSREQGLINEEKMEALRNFTEESCLELGPELNLFVNRLTKVYPWYINALSSNTVNYLYRDLLQSVEQADEKTWEEMAEKILPLDRALSEVLSAAGQPHYTVRYNDFMAVKFPCP